MRTVTVTIGRNVGTEPLPAEEWNDFVFGTRRAVETVTSELFASGPSRGSWDGVAEDAFYFYGPVWSPNTAECLSFLRARLSVLATKYRQDAIGLSVGDAELVESFSTPAPVHAESDAEVFAEATGRLPRHADELNAVLRERGIS